MLDIHKLDSLIKQKGYTNIALSKILESYGIKKNEATIRKYRYGINDPDTKTLSILADILDVTEQDLFVGAIKRREKIVKEEIKNFSQNSFSCKILNDDTYISVDKSLIDDNKAHKIVALKITGDSMTPYLHPGDLAICELLDETPNEDGKYLILVGTKYFIKNVKFFANNNIGLISENELYRNNHEFDEECTTNKNKTIPSIKIAGKVIGRFLRN